MISPATARNRIARCCRRLPSARVSIDAALGTVLAEDVRAPHPLPMFDNSAMDGFAVRASDTTRAKRSAPVRLVIVRSVYAGDTDVRRLGRGEACAIMTGGVMPRGADAVIPNERATVATPAEPGTRAGAGHRRLATEQAAIQHPELVVSEPVTRFRHVRRCGEEIKHGARIIARGAIVHPGVVACLAAVGKSTVRVIRRPVVSVITTGTETVPPGVRLRRGQVFDSNSHMIRAQLRHMGIVARRVRHVNDHPAKLTSVVRTELERSDVLIVVGGVSVGDRDYVRDVLEHVHVRQVFWRVAQKPGKPLYFGTKGRKLVFGLPGNPASAFTCFYVYVYEALRRLAGFREPSLRRSTMAVEENLVADTDKWRFLKAVMGGDGVARRLPRQGSHMITSLVQANGLIAAPPGNPSRTNDVLSYWLPYFEDVKE